MHARCPEGKVFCSVTSNHIGGIQCFASVICVMATPEEPQKAASGNASLAKGEAWIDVAAMGVLVLILIIVFYIL